MSTETINEYTSSWEDIPRDIKLVLIGVVILLMGYLPLTLIFNLWESYVKLADFTVGMFLLYLLIRVIVLKATKKTFLKAIENLVVFTIVIISALIFAKNYTGQYIMREPFIYDINRDIVEVLAVTQGKIVGQLGEEGVKELGNGAIIITILYLTYWLVNIIKWRTTRFVEYERMSIILRVNHSIVESIASGVMLVVTWSGLVWLGNYGKLTSAKGDVMIVLIPDIMLIVIFVSGYFFFVHICMSFKDTIVKIN